MRSDALSPTAHPLEQLDCKTAPIANAMVVESRDRARPARGVCNAAALRNTHGEYWSRGPRACARLSDSARGHLSQRSGNCVHTSPCAWTVLAALVTIIRNWKRSQPFRERTVETKKRGNPNVSRDTPSQGVHRLRGDIVPGVQPPQGVHPSRGIHRPMG